MYAAEEFVRTMFDRAATTGNRSLDFFGAAITLPPEARFATVESVRRYVDDVLDHPAVRTRWPAVAPVAVRARRGERAAHYEWTSEVAVIAVPDGESGWALRELVVLHELAHHLARCDPPHGPGFVAAFCELTSAVMGPEVGYVLRVVYAKEGVR